MRRMSGPETRLLKPASDPPGSKPATPRIATEHLAQASRRLSLFAGAFAGIIVFVLTLNAVLTEIAGWPAPKSVNWLRACQGGMVVLCLGIVALSRTRLSPAFILNAGLVYEVACAFLIALQYYVSDILLPEHVLSVSWLCVWVVMFPLIVPATPGRNIFASYLSASMGPLLLGICMYVHPNERPPIHKIVYAFLPNYIAATMAIIPAYLIYRLNTNVSLVEKKLREMGSYQLVKLLGKGGMGEVWLAEHRMIARPAAIKLVQPAALAEESQASRESMVKRFEQEARVTASLHSPNTVSLYDFGTTEDGTFYYVMELLHGMDLESLVIKNGPIGPARTVHVLKQACESLAEAHHTGLIHRDIKPANLYLCRLGLRHDFVKVLDFGLVLRAQGCQGMDARLTGQNSIVGTPAFMPPEMAEGRCEVDGRADIYALGCVAYWLLAGTHVFDVDRPPMQILMDHIATPPVPLSKRAPQPIPPALDQIIARCLAKKPEDRPANALDLWRMLDKCPLDDQWSHEDARRWWVENLPEDAIADEDPSRRLAETMVKAKARTA
jgi:serine/threonine-protein kinase